MSGDFFFAFNEHKCHTALAQEFVSPGFSKQIVAGCEESCTYHEVPLYMAMEKPCSGIVGPVSVTQISYERICCYSNIIELTV